VQALAEAGDDSTAITNVFTGRPARGIVNRLMRELGPISEAVPAFPTAGAALSAVRAQAEKASRGDFTNLWAGQSARLAPRMGAFDLTRNLYEAALMVLGRRACSRSGTTLWD
jgi:nitronate monooxygenase